MPAPESIQDPCLLPPLDLPPAITSRFVDTSATTSLKFHILESVPIATTHPPKGLILLVHGFPNLAYDWRRVLPHLSEQGYHAVAFDQRGFGRTHKADLTTTTPLDDSRDFRPLTLVRDVVSLVHALGYTAIHTLVGHDLGAVTASLCALIRPDLVRSLVLMSHPYKGPPSIPFGTSPSCSPLLPIPPSDLSPPPPPKDPYAPLRDPDIHTSLLALSPPRQHYKWYNSSPRAPAEWSLPSAGPTALHTFLRGYFHLKSADWPANNDAHPLKSWTAGELAKLPPYYVMHSPFSMRDNIAREMARLPHSVTASLPSTPWLPDAELDVYVREYARTGFADPLRWYRVFTDAGLMEDIQVWAGARIGVPTLFVSGKLDWGNYQEPGALEAMEGGGSVREGCYLGSVFVEGAGHWVAMERPGECVREILGMADGLGA